MLKLQLSSRCCAVASSGTIASHPEVACMHGTSRLLHVLASCCCMSDRVPVVLQNLQATVSSMQLCWRCAGKSARGTTAGQPALLLEHSTGSWSSCCCIAGSWVRSEKRSLQRQ